jgi:hypothetical protein
MTYNVLVEMFEGEFAYMCRKQFQVVSMRG